MNEKPPCLSEQFQVLEELYLRLRFSRLAEMQDFQSLSQQFKSFKQSVNQIKKLQSQWQLVKKSVLEA